MRLLTPDYEYKSVGEIDPKIFTKKKLLIFDVDNTLFYTETTRTKPEIVKWFKTVNRKNYKFICLSNCRHINSRKKKISQLFGCEVFESQYRKPRNIVFRELLKTYNIPPEKMVMIGDQRLTDILFGNRHGMTTVLVEPLGKDVLFRIKLSRVVAILLLFLTRPFQRN